MPLVDPHGGGELTPLLLEDDALAAERKRAAGLAKVRVSSREKGDLMMLGIGGFTPLEGFMSRADWQGVCDGMRTASGLFWPIPITLSTDASTAATLSTGQFGDKIGHFVLYGILTLLIDLTLLRSLPLLNPKMILFRVALILILLIGIEEYSQQFFRNRSFDLVDLTYSYLGVIFFSWVALRVRRT